MKSTRRRYLDITTYIALAAIVGTLVWALLSMRRIGHWWGDDWALYIRQAEAILNGTTDVVATENAFTVNQSAGAPFSPPIYPWGYPLALALAIPIVGNGVDDLSIVSVIAAAVYFLSFFALARPRLGTVPALVAVPAVCFTPQLVGWIDLIQSEWVFMAVVGVTLVGLDALIRDQRLLADSTPLWLLIALGFGAAAGFEVRREGLAMIAAIGLGQLAALGDTWRTMQAADARRRVAYAARFAVPHLSFLAVTLAIKTLVPAVIIPRYDGAGVGNVWRYRDRHVEHLAELIGFKRSQADTPTLLGSVGWGWTITIIWFVLVAVGLVLALSKNRRRDAHLAGYVVISFIIGCSAKAALARYFASMAPIATLLALTALATGLQLLASWRQRSPNRRRRRLLSKLVTPVVLSTLLMLIVVANGIDAQRRIENTQLAAEQGSVEWGAQHPDAIEMFAFINANTDAGDTLASFKARSTVLMTGLNTIQTDDYRPLNEDIDVRFVILEAGGSRDREFRDRADWIVAFRNRRLVVYEPLPALPGQ